MPDVQVSPEARGAHLRTMRSLLVSEGATLGDLLGATAKTRDARIKNANDARVIAREASRAIGNTLEVTNARSRSVALGTLRGEYSVAKAEAIKSDVDPLSMPPQIPGSRTNDDHERALLVERQSHIDMLKQAERILANADRAKNATGADILPKYALESIAATETVASFHEERVRAEKLTAERYQGSHWLPAMVILHDATLDVRTCAVCRGLDNTIRPLGVSFAKPLPIHRRCRCVRVLIFVLAFLGRKEVDQAA